MEGPIVTTLFFGVNDSVIYLKTKAGYENNFSINHKIKKNTGNKFSKFSFPILEFDNSKIKMNLSQLDSKILGLIQPDIKCFVKSNKELGQSKVGIDYYSLNFRLIMSGGVEEGVLNIGQTLYEHDLKEAYIQIFNENERLVCNQEFKIQKQGRVLDSSERKFDFVMNILPDSNTKTGFTYAIERGKEIGGNPTTGKVIKNSCGQPIFNISKDILIQLCYGLIERHNLPKEQQRVFEIQINIHQLDFKNKNWKITINPFTVTKKI